MTVYRIDASCFHYSVLLAPAVALVSALRLAVALGWKRGAKAPRKDPRKNGALAPGLCLSFSLLPLLIRQASTPALSFDPHNRLLWTE